VDLSAQKGLLASFGLELFCESGDGLLVFDHLCVEVLDLVFVLVATDRQFVEIALQLRDIIILFLFDSCQLSLRLLDVGNVLFLHLFNIALQLG
jgi:hypothetical protein